MSTTGNHTSAAPETATQAVLRTVEMLYPVVLLVAFVVAAGVHSIVTSRSEEDIIVPTVRGPGGKPLPVTKRKREDRQPETVEGYHVGPAGRRFFQYVTAGIILTFIANGVAVAVHTLGDHFDDDDDERWWCGEERTIYVAGAAFMYLYYLVTLLEWSESPNIVHGFVWALGLIGEVIILLCTLITSLGPHYVIKNVRLWTYEHVDGPDRWDLVDIGIGTVRLCLVAGLVGVYGSLTLKRYLKDRQLALAEEARSQSEADENTPLLERDGPEYHTQGRQETDRRSQNNTDVSNTNGAADASYQQQDEDAAFYRPEKLPHKTWWEYCRGYSIFFPYLWPSKSLRLQLVVLVCFILLVCQRVVNILVPFQVGVVTDRLTEASEGSHHMPWIALTLLVLFKLLQGPSGALGSLRSVLWIPVSQHTYRALTTAAFQHVHSLSLDFHLGKRTGEVLSALNKGASINQFLEQVTFQVLPMLVDLLVAIVFFYVNFSALYAMFVSVITFFYLHLTIRMAATRADQRRDMVNADREEEAVKNDSITSYETVKYFNAEQYEFRKYDDAIKNYQKAEYHVTWGINHMNICQTLVFMCGILVAMMTAAYEVTRGSRSVGDFVLLITYLGQLQGPLNFFGTFYRTVQQAMISGERLLELFKIQPTVVDKPSAKTLESCEGRIRWSKVQFAYDRRRPALHNMTFECAPGTTTAFVGESGGGKSTVFRLMFRYYNCREGRIEIDGRDVKDLTIDSVRRFIGVVPQDTILFNETLMYNLKYANQNATNEEVFEACRSAAIHDRIMSFPDGYNTKVGERGLRLSGGEKQRVAIARTILKNPKIIMLDEATSALDGETEQRIQAKLISGNLGQGRTLLIIAHRLSTITHADQIIVLHNGTIVEKGTHHELLAKCGRYASMWEKHCRAERAVEAARAATTRANKLLRQANIPGTTTHGDDRSDGYNSMASSTILQTGPPSPREGTIASQHDDESSAASSSENESPRATSPLHIPRATERAE